MGVRPGYKQTEVGVIPQDWDVAPSPSLVWYQEGPGVRNHQFTISGVKLFNGTNIENGRIRLDNTSRYISEYEAYGPYSHFLADAGDIVIACSGISVSRFDEKVAVLSVDDLPLCMNTSTMRFKVRSARLHKEYLRYFLRSQLFKDQISGRATGSAQLNFGPAHVSAVLVPLPPTDNEQHAIATALGDIDALIESLERLASKKRYIKQGAMQELLTGKRRLLGSQAKWGFKKTELGPIPEDWETKALEGIVDCLDNLRVPLNESQRATRRGDIPYCGANGVLDYIDDFVVDDDIILIAEDGGYFDEYLTRPIAYRMSGKCWVNNHAHILKAKPDADQGFLYYSLVHKNILRFLASGTRAKLNRSELNKIEVPWPPTKAEQAAIANILSDMDAEIAALEAKLAKVSSIKRGMMQELLTGKIRLV